MVINYTRLTRIDEEVSVIDGLLQELKCAKAKNAYMGHTRDCIYTVCIPIAYACTVLEAFKSDLQEEHRILLTEK